VAVYCFIVTIPLFGLLRILKRIKFFSDPEDWTVLKELLSVVLSLTGMGIVVCFSGFLLEPPGQRWNLATFLEPSLYGEVAINSFMRLHSGIRVIPSSSMTPEQMIADTQEVTNYLRLSWSCPVNFFEGVYDCTCSYSEVE
jgi:hypothetical protein